MALHEKKGWGSYEYCHIEYCYIQHGVSKATFSLKCKDVGMQYMQAKATIRNRVQRQGMDDNNMCLHLGVDVKEM